jgi:hypothetical protein
VKLQGGVGRFMIKSFARLAVLVWSIAAIGIASAAQREVKTPYYSVTLTPDGEAIESLSVDSLGKSEFKLNALFVPEEKPIVQPPSHQEPAAVIRSRLSYVFLTRDRSPHFGWLHCIGKL